MVREVNRLKLAQESYNALMNEAIEPLLRAEGLSREEFGFVEISEALSDPTLKRRHTRLAIELLEANINEYEAFAQEMPIPTASLASTPVVFTLLAAALGYAVAGPVGALVSAALGYYFADRQSRINLRDARRSAEVHNADVASWRKTVYEWRKELEELQRAEA